MESKDSLKDVFFKEYKLLINDLTDEILLRLKSLSARIGKDKADGVAVAVLVRITSLILTFELLECSCVPATKEELTPFVKLSDKVNSKIIETVQGLLAEFQGNKEVSDVQ